MNEFTAGLLCGIVTVHLSQFIFAQIRNAVDKKTGRLWVCKVKGCGTSARGGDPETVKLARNIHLDSTPEHREANA